MLVSNVNPLAKRQTMFAGNLTKSRISWLCVNGSNPDLVTIRSLKKAETSVSVGLFRGSGSTQLLMKCFKAFGISLVLPVKTVS